MLQAHTGLAVETPETVDGTTLRALILEIEALSDLISEHLPALSHDLRHRPDHRLRVRPPGGRRPAHPAAGAGRRCPACSAASPARSSISPEPAERRQFVDFFGNAGVEVAFREAHDEILFRVAARVERLAEPPGLDISPELARLADEIADYRGLDADAPHHFLGAEPAHRARRRR